MKKRIISIVLVIILGTAALFLYSGCSGGEEKVVRAEYSPGDYFTTNVAGGSPRVFKCVPILVVNKEGLDETLKAQNATIRDTIIFILRELTEEDIRAPGNFDDLRERIVDALNERLGVDYFVEVIFNDFVMG